MQGEAVSDRWQLVPREPASSPPPQQGRPPPEKKGYLARCSRLSASALCRRSARRATSCRNCGGEDGSASVGRGRPSALAETSPPCPALTSPSSRRSCTRRAAASTGGLRDSAEGVYQPRPRPGALPAPSPARGPAHPEAPSPGLCASSRSRSCSSAERGRKSGSAPVAARSVDPTRPSPQPRPHEGGAPLTSLQQPPQPAPAPLPRLQLRPHVLPPAPAPHACPPHGPPGLAVRAFLTREGRRRREDGGGGGGRVQLGPGQRAPAAAGGAGARDRRGAAERRDGDPGAVQGEAERAAAGPAGGAVRGLGAEGGGGALGTDPLPDAGGHPAAARGLELRGAQGLPDGPEARRLRPPQAGRAGPRLRADAGAVAPGPGRPRDPPRRGRRPTARFRDPARSPA